MSMAHPLLELEDLGFCRKGQNKESVTILDGLSFQVRCGEVTAIVGPSGGGKSSVLRIINRLEESTGGLRLEGQELRSLDPVALRQRIALVPQKSILFEGSVYDNLLIPLRYRKKSLPPIDAPELAELLERCALEPGMLSRAARSLSGGQQQRLCLARALMTRPEILLLDEPTSALDPPNVERLGQVLALLRDQGEIAIVLVSHDLALVRQLADQVVFLDRGRILALGSLEELTGDAAPAAVADFFRRRG